MDKEEFDAMEVKPKDSGFYFVTLYQFKKEKPEHPNYIRDWLEFNGTNWEYDGFEGSCYVCFIEKKDTSD